MEYQTISLLYFFGCDRRYLSRTIATSIISRLIISCFRAEAESSVIEHADTFYAKLFL